jgi:hypothetical protein
MTALSLIFASNSLCYPDRRQGQWVYYRLHPELPTWVTEVLKGVVDANQQWLDTETKRLCGMNDRPVNQTVCG